MTYQLESQPDLVHPDHWDDFDIYDPTMFAVDTPGLTEANVTPVAQMFAQKCLKEGLTRVMQLGYFETQLSGTATGNCFTSGDIVILDQEQVKRRKVEDDSVITKFLDNPQLHQPHSRGIPIAPPYVQFWRQSQIHPDNTLFGVEQAYFDDGVIYQRHLRWGVYTEFSNGHQAIVSTGLGSCVLNGQSVELGGEAIWRGTVLPFEVGKVNLVASRVSGGIMTRSLNRLIQLRRVHFTG